MNEVAQTVTPVTEPIDPAFDALPEFLKQPFKDGTPVEVQGEEEIGEVKETLN